jgi:hypothetical protein
MLQLSQAFLRVLFLDLAFLYYINDIPAGLSSTILLFADDTIAYLAIKSNRDALTLQQDLDKLSNWGKKIGKWHSTQIYAMGSQ